MRFALVGSGFVADYYLTTLANYPQHSIVGAYDIDAKRLAQFSQFYGVKSFSSYEQLLADTNVEAVLVLSWPQNHAELCLQALEVGKHVYCEKPMAINMDDARMLASRAAKNNLVLASAPANAHSDAFALVETTLHSGAIGAPKLVYAEMEDGAVFREQWREWRSLSGAPWPGDQEFEVGCVLEHSGYTLSWLIGLFGSVKSIAGTSAVTFPDKGVALKDGAMGIDFTTAVLSFDSNVIVRLTCGLCAPKDRSMTIMGEQGTLTITDVWDSRSDVVLENKQSSVGILYRLIRRYEWWRGRFISLKPTGGTKLRYRTKNAKNALPKFPSQIDFWAGPNVLSSAVAGDVDRQKAMTTHALHITEAQIALNDLPLEGGRYTMTTSL